MNYDLARKLKEAGFPQGQKNYCTYRNCSCHKNKKCGECSGCWWIKIPTLEELIEACGEDFGQLIRYDHHWHAETIDDTETYLEAEGSSPTEAVSNLYIALHTKG